LCHKLRKQLIKYLNVIFNEISLNGYLHISYKYLAWTVIIKFLYVPIIIPASYYISK